MVIFVTFVLSLPLLSSCWSSTSSFSMYLFGLEGWSFWVWYLYSILSWDSLYYFFEVLLPDPPPPLWGGNYHSFQPCFIFLCQPWIPFCYIYLWLWSLFLWSMYYMFELNVSINYHELSLSYRLKLLDPLQM